MQDKIQTLLTIDVYNTVRSFKCTFKLLGENHPLNNQFILKLYLISVSIFCHSMFDSIIAIEMPELIGRDLYFEASENLVNSFSEGQMGPLD